MDTELRPVMNDTKWRELIGSMRLLQDRGWLIQHHAKDVRGPWPSPRGWDGEWYYHLLAWKDLEWVDIKCDHREGQAYKAPIALSDEEQKAIYAEIRAALNEHAIPFSIESGLVRVWGYTRAGVTPEWQL
jgi:hypothetical protein